MQVLVSDTSVLIDLERAGLLKTVFRLPCRFCVPDALYVNEIEPFEELSVLIELGLEVHEISPEGVGRAFSYRRMKRGLSAPDALALALAREHGWILLTGDQGLRALAVEEGVEPHGVLWVFDRLQESGLVAAAQLIVALTRVMEHPRCRLPRAEITARLEAWDLLREGG